MAPRNVLNPRSELGPHETQHGSTFIPVRIVPPGVAGGYPTGTVPIAERQAANVEPVEEPEPMEEPPPLCSISRLDGLSGVSFPTRPEASLDRNTTAKAAKAAKVKKGQPKVRAAKKEQPKVRAAKAKKGQPKVKAAKVKKGQPKKKAAKVQPKKKPEMRKPASAARIANLLNHNMDEVAEPADSETENFLGASGRTR